MGVPFIALVLVTFVFLWYLRKSRKDEEERRRKGLKIPPGPSTLPIIGNLHQLGSFTNKKFTEWSKEYGDIYQVWMGNRLLIVISNPKWTKEIFSDSVFSGRPYFMGFDIYEDHPKLGIINSDGELWETHRRFLLRQLRDFGFGKSSMENLILDEVNEVIARFKKFAGKPVGSIKDTLRLANVNALWSILTSERFKQDDPELLRFALNTSQTFNEVLESGAVLVFLPWVKYIAPGFSGYTKVRKMFDENERFFKETVERHKKNLNVDDPKDFVDVFLAEIQKTTDPKSTFYGAAGERQLIAILFDLFVAGGDTTSTAISWTILYLCMFPEAQKKLQQEIDDITGGNSRKVSVGDKSSMPYTLALIDEVLRYSSLASEGVQHNAMADKEFQGYFIPKDAMIQPNHYYIHHNPTIWGDPENFRPERFLEAAEDNDTRDDKKRTWKYKRNENLQAFQVGRRQCVGESLARDTIFLFVTHLFQQFIMEFDPNDGGVGEKPSLESEIGFLRSPLPFWVTMKDRLASQ